MNFSFSIDVLTPYIGYMASIFIVASFLFKNIKTIRIINLLGCICFVIYGLFIEKEPLYPIIIPNAILALVQLYFLMKKE